MASHPPSTKTDAPAEGAPLLKPLKKRRRPGRPRRAVGDPERHVREEILVAASRLFAEHGFAGTSIQQIADELDIRSPTIYHYFHDKQDIIREIARYTIETSLIYAHSLSETSASPTQNLYNMLVEHVERLCASPYDLKGLVDVNPYKFEGLDLWREQVRLWGERLRKLVRRGIRSGEFRRVDVEIVYSAVIALVGSVLRESAAELRAHPRRTANFVAVFVLRALMVDPSHLEDIIPQRWPVRRVPRA